MVQAAVFVFSQFKNIIRLIYIYIFYIYLFATKIERNTFAVKKAWYLKHNALFRLRIAKHVPL